MLYVVFIVFFWCMFGFIGEDGWIMNCDWCIFMLLNIIFCFLVKLLGDGVILVMFWVVELFLIIKLRG